MRCVLVLTATTLLSMNRTVRTTKHESTVASRQARGLKAESRALGGLLNPTPSLRFTGRRIKALETENLPSPRFMSTRSPVNTQRSNANPSSHSPKNGQRFIADTPSKTPFRIPKSSVSSDNQLFMVRFSLALVAVAATAFAAATKPAEDGSWSPGRFEGEGTPYDDGMWTAGRV